MQHDTANQTPMKADWWDGYFDESFIELYRAFLTPERTRREVRGLLSCVGVLRLEVGDGLGVGLVAQPLVVVDEDAAVVLPPLRPLDGDGCGDAGGGRRLVHAETIPVLTACSYATIAPWKAATTLTPM